MRVRAILGLTAAGAVLLAAGCARGEQAAEEGEQQEPQMQQVPAPDTTAAALWAHMEAANYRENWTLWPGKGRLYTGQEPHGMLLTTYLNDAALNALNTRAGTMPRGAIVVKENYMPDSTLAAITIMYKAAAGYNAEHNNWFFVKRLASGELDRMPDGTPMEGRVPGCQNCHGAQQANDYIFTGSLSAAQ